MMENGYIDTAIQKGGIPGFSGCLEHAGVLNQIIQEAKDNNSNLIVAWLDLANVGQSLTSSFVQH